jgi:hypothetical protein
VTFFSCEYQSSNCKLRPSPRAKSLQFVWHSVLFPTIATFIAESQTNAIAGVILFSLYQQDNFLFTAEELRS